MRTFSRNLSGTDFAQRLAVLSKCVYVMETECNRQIVSTRLIEKSKAYANRTGGTSL